MKRPKNMMKLRYIVILDPKIYGDTELWLRDEKMNEYTNVGSKVPCENQCRPE